MHFGGAELLQDVGDGQFPSQNDLDAIAVAAKQLSALVRGVQIELEGVRAACGHISTSRRHIDRTLQVGRRVFQFLSRKIERG